MDDLIRRAPIYPDWAGVLDFVFDEGEELAIPTLSPPESNNALVFPPEFQNIDPRLSRPRRSQSNPYIIEAMIHLQAFLNYLQVAQVGPKSRLIVINGVHRAYALWRAGWKYIPCLLRRAQNLSEIGFPPGRLGIPPEERMLHDAHPPYLQHFLNDEVAPRFSQRCFNHAGIQPQRINVDVI